MISEDLWRERLGDMPMPPEATVEMMWAAYDALDEIRQRDEDLEMIKWFQKSRGMWERCINYFELNPDIRDSAKRIECMKKNIILIDEGIDFLRERLID